MVGLDFFTPSDIEMYGRLKHGCKDREEFKRNLYFVWYTYNEIIEFSKGNRDYIAGHIPNQENGGNMEMPLILNPKYKKKVKKDGTIIVTHYAYENSPEDQWTKQTYICNAETGLTLVEYTKTHKCPK